MEACAVICRKAHVMLPEANFISPWCQSPSSRAQNRDFCALLGFGTLVFRHFEHEIVVFVLFWPSKPLFSGILSTKSGFLCFFGLRDPCFRAFRAQNRHFCALVLRNMASGSRKARKFLFLHAFKLLLPVGNCRQSTWNRGT